MEEPRERVFRCQTRGHERQAEETYLSIHEGIGENNRNNGTDGRTKKMRAYNPISERTYNSPSNQGPGTARGTNLNFNPRGY